MKKALRSWTHSWNDFYSESFPHDPDTDNAEEDEEQEDEAEDEPKDKETNWMSLWALCVSMGVPDSEWPDMTIPKIRALSKEKDRNYEFEVTLHGGTLKNKKPKTAKSLSDLGFFPK